MLFFLLACQTPQPSAPAASGGPLTLFYTGNVDGDIEPCG